MVGHRRLNALHRRYRAGSQQGSRTHHILQLCVTLPTLSIIHPADCRVIQLLRGSAGGFCRHRERRVFCEFMVVLPNG